MCVGQPLLIVVLFFEGFSFGRFIDHALAYSVGAGMEPDMTCKFKLDEMSCSCALAASTACRVTDTWFTPHCSLSLPINIRRWVAEVSCPRATKPVWPACWADTPDRSAASSSEVVHDIWDIREELGVVPPGLILALRTLRPTVLMTLGVPGVLALWLGFCRRIAERVALSLVVCKLFLVAALFAVWEVVLPDKEMRLMRPRLSTLSTPPLAPVLLLRRRIKSVADVLRGFRQHGFSQGRWDALCGRWKSPPTSHVRTLYPLDSSRSSWVLQMNF